LQRISAAYLLHSRPARPVRQVRTGNQPQDCEHSHLTLSLTSQVCATKVTDERPCRLGLAKLDQLSASDVCNLAAGATCVRIKLDRVEAG